MVITAVSDDNDNKERLKIRIQNLLDWKYLEDDNDK